LFQDCTNVTLRGLAVDYDPLPFTQGKIIALATDKSWIEFEVAKGYPKNEMRVLPDLQPCHRQAPPWRWTLES
jgi:hypothetical protein